jgi:hypothetical protein
MPQNPGGVSARSLSRSDRRRRSAKYAGAPLATASANAAVSLAASANTLALVAEFDGGGESGGAVRKPWGHVSSETTTSAAVSSPRLRAAAIQRSHSSQGWFVEGGIGAGVGVGVGVGGERTKLDAGCDIVADHVCRLSV